MSRRLLMLGAVPAVIMFVTLMMFFTSARLEDARADLSASSQSLAHNLAPAVEYAVLSGNRPALEETLKQALKRNRAQWIQVSDVNGNQLGFASKLSGQTEPKAGADVDIYTAEILQKPVDIAEGELEEWFAPPYGFGRGALKLGTVEVAVSQQALAETQKEIVWTSLGVGFAILLFTLLIVNHILGGLMAPIHRLSERVKRLASRDYSEAPIVIDGGTREISELEESLNSLAQHLGALQAARDETLGASERQRERAEEANRVKSEFLATVSHELRTPMNGILGMIDLMNEDPLSARQQDYLQTVRQSTEDLLTVIKDVLDYSAIDRGTLKLENRDFNLADLISNCAASYRGLAESRSLSLSTSLIGEWPKNPMVTGDSARLRQIFGGILDSMVNFSAAGELNLTAGWFNLEGDCMMLNCSISDSGSGIPSDRIEDMFDSFDQMENPDHHELSGLGFGLPLMQRLVELMGGYIKVENEGGKIIAFRLEIPFQLANVAEPSEADPDSPLSEDGHKARALVVEDNLVNQRVALALLRRLGFDVEAANTGKEGVERVRNNHFGYDVILMDCQMPVMDGYEATRQIREWERENGQNGTPIIALTADTLPGTETQCLNAGMDDYLSKPVRKDQLRRVLSRWLNV